MNKPLFGSIADDPGVISRCQAHLSFCNLWIYKPMSTATDERSPQPCSPNPVTRDMRASQSALLRPCELAIVGRRSRHVASRSRHHSTPCSPTSRSATSSASTRWRSSWGAPWSSWGQTTRAKPRQSKRSRCGTSACGAGMRSARGRRRLRSGPGVAVNRRDLVAIPVPHANLLWRGLKVRNVHSVDGKQTTSNIRIDITVSGVGENREWVCGLEFDYANEESFYCRPLRLSEDRNPRRMGVPDAAGKVPIAFLPPMSGLAATETRLDQGAVNVRVGEGRTAEVLRNLCHRVHEEGTRWADLVRRIDSLFGAELRPPRYIPERGEIAMSLRGTRRHARPLLRGTGSAADPAPAGVHVREPWRGPVAGRARRTSRDPSPAANLPDADRHGRGDRQPDHRGQSFRSPSQRGRRTGSGDRLCGRSPPVGQSRQPGPESPQGIRVRALLPGRADGWVLYLEGSTDLSILRALAARLNHEPALRALERRLFTTSAISHPQRRTTSMPCGKRFPGSVGSRSSTSLPSICPTRPRWYAACGCGMKSRTTWLLGAHWSDMLPLRLRKPCPGRCSRSRSRPRGSMPCASPLQSSRRL